MSESTEKCIGFLVWRDTAHPEGGGSELYVEKVAAGLAQQGHHVTIFCAAHSNAPADEVRDGIRFRRRGGRLGVYLRALLFLLSPSGRRLDLVVDVQNGLPFFSPLVRRRGVVALVHHVHQGQWRVIYPGLRGRIGWWLESKVAPRLYRGLPYVTVSEASSADLQTLGVDPAAITIVHNGLDHPDLPDRVPAEQPRLCCVSRLVPHKQVEHALEVLARLRADGIRAELDVVGDGWWMDHLVQRAGELQVADLVTFHGFVSDQERDEILSRVWVFLVPSLKEGWGIAIIEAASAGVPAIGYRQAGGVAEAIVDGVTGLVVEDFDGLYEGTRELLSDEPRRRRMGAAAARRSRAFSWDHTAEQFAKVLGVPDATSCPAG